MEEEESVSSLRQEAGAYKAGKDVLDPKCSIRLTTSQEEMDQHKASVLSDPFASVPLSVLDDLPPSPKCSKKFDNSSLKYSDFMYLLKSRRNGSSPGINQLPYKVYKLCPQISSFLFNLFTCFVKRSYVPIQWRVAKETYIPKTKPPSPNNIKDYRPIALLNVEGKLFFSLISRRLEDHIIKKNKFINKSIQKGCMEKVPGCWEHMSMVWETLKSSKTAKSCVSVVWLDVANAYGSIPHKLIFYALKRYGVPDLWIDLIMSYYRGLWSKSFSESAPSDWHQHLRGIFTGCTLSIILFLSGINIVIEYVSVNCEVLAPPMKAFMDDLALLSESVPELQRLLDRCVKVLNWAGMSFRASKSRSIIIENGKTIKKSVFVVRDSKSGKLETIPSIHLNPVRFLGRTISVSLSDTDSINSFSNSLFESLEAIDKSFFTGQQKIWILHHLLIPRIRWPLQIYEVSISVVFKLEQKISSFIRKWLNLHHSLTNIALYSSISPCPLPLKSLSKVLKEAKVSGHLLLRDSQDRAISENCPHLRSGKWNVNSSVSTAEAEILLRKLTGPSRVGRSGFGYVKQTSIPERGTSSYRKLISSVVSEFEEEESLARATQLHLQGNWTNWCDFVKIDLSWKSLLALPSPLLSFCIQATYETLPSSSNLHRWKLIEEPKCVLCNNPTSTVSHVLSACKVALNQGRYTYRHDSILSVLVCCISDFLSSYQPNLCSKPNHIQFVRAGEKCPKKNGFEGILHSADDWSLISDNTDKKLVVPPYLAITTLRPDILLISKRKKQVVIIELTSPCEENFQSRHSDKVLKYSHLCQDIRSKDWKVFFFAVEVGARGYCAKTVRVCLRSLGFPNKRVTSSLKSLSLCAIKSSFVIWMSRDSKEWDSSYLLEKNDDRPIKITPKYTSSCQSSTNRTQPSGERQKEASNITSSNFKLNGLLNKGNTCYVNSILQCLRALTSFISNLLNLTDVRSAMTRSFSLVCRELTSSKSVVDPSQFLLTLKNVIVKEGNTAFNVFSQQDAAEILVHIISEFAISSPIISPLFQTSVSISKVCEECGESSSSAEICSILRLPVARSVKESLQKLAGPVVSDSFCYFCDRVNSCVEEKHLSNVGKYLVIQLLRFSQVNGNCEKDTEQVLCDQKIEIACLNNEDSSPTRHFVLKGTINHLGTLQNGHYSAFVPDPSGSTWLHCDDRVVLPCRKEVLDSTSVYLLFYEEVH